MEKIKAEEIVKATGGKLLKGDPQTAVTGISIDTRTLSEGMAFFALKGEKTDGHAFLNDAARAGSAALIIEKEDILLSDFSCPDSTAIIKVDNTEQALQELAAWYLSLFDIRKIGITGSTGKTSTKEMLFYILSEKYKTIRNQGNYNNLIGLPLSVFQVDKNTEAAIFEMGMDRLGEIHRLAEIVRPNAAIITNIGVSHLERLGSRENILKAKTEICDFFKKDNTLIVNGDDDLLSKNHSNGNYNFISVGKKEGSELRIAELKDLSEKGIEFCLITGNKRVKYCINSPGVHNSTNGALAVAAALLFDVSMEQAALGLARFFSSDKRLNIISGNGIKIIDDTYNASPDSMKAALEVLSSAAGIRKIAILGDMFELGDEEEEFHRSIGEYASQKGINVLLSVGKNAKQISLGAQGGKVKTFHFENKDMLIAALPQWIIEGDTILVKGSRGMEMDEIVKYLKDTGE
ncbi:MAG TPA: UDP-N-acetylmuramoyl-tripeptide--D-alanyl-D-alanine ligase [Bacillota bacterium]|nr:UDP-N-acetylmuramoyl-tripeptide--D-alanyl-D-alanine ligase [Bacillota bacterium]